MLDRRTAETQERKSRSEGAAGASQGIDLARHARRLLLGGALLAGLGATFGISEKVYEGSMPVGPSSEDVARISFIAALNNEAYQACTAPISDEDMAVISSDCASGEYEYSYEEEDCVNDGVRSVKMDRFGAWVRNERISKISNLGYKDESWQKCDPAVAVPVRGGIAVSEGDAFMPGTIDPVYKVSAPSGGIVGVTANSLIHDPLEEGKYIFVVDTSLIKDDLVAGQLPVEAAK